MKSKTNRAALSEAVKILGGVASAAKLLHRSEQAMYLYLSGRREFPCELCPTVERLTRERGKAITCERLRPGVEWSYLRTAQEAPQPASPEPSDDAAPKRSVVGAVKAFIASFLGRNGQ